MLSQAAFSSLSSVLLTNSPGATENVCAASDRLRARINAAALRIRSHHLASSRCRKDPIPTLVLYRAGFINGIRREMLQGLKAAPFSHFSGRAEAGPPPNSNLYAAASSTIT